jgi:AbrB family looped-hinge helix DNA binding protein
MKFLPKVGTDLQRVFNVKVAKKGQIVIPKPLRDRFRIHANSRVTLTAVDEGVLIRPPSPKPWSHLRGMLRGKMAAGEFDELMEEAKRSLFRFTPKVET